MHNVLYIDNKMDKDSRGNLDPELGVLTYFGFDPIQLKNGFVSDPGPTKIRGSDP